MTRCLNGHDVIQYTFPWCTLLLRRGLRTLSGVGTCSRASRQSNSSSFCDRSLAPLERWPSLIGVVLFCLYPPPPQAPPFQIACGYTIFWGDLPRSAFLVDRVGLLSTLAFFPPRTPHWLKPALQYDLERRRAILKEIQGRSPFKKVPLS